MNVRSAGPPPLSPNGSEWSGFSHYQNSQPAPSPGLSHNRGNLITPPISGSSNDTRPRMSSSANGRPGGPSPPNSIRARSSYGTTMSSTDAKRRQTLQMEDRLLQHHTILKRFLGQSLRDEKGNPKPNRARDKLLRLSGIQFQELSTDVYDELLRRQSAQGQQTNGPGQVPPYLLPKDNFHPKRNQARQKLATLPHSRFRDLATDVFYELERRFPNFAGRDIPHNGSPALGPPSRVGTPNGVRPGAPGYGPRNRSLSGQVMGGMGIPAGPDDQHGRPTAKQFHSNTIIPNKSTMVEDDDDDGFSDIYGSRRDTTYTLRSMGGSDKDRKAIADFETQVTELQGRLKELEDQIQAKDSELNKINEQHNHTINESKNFSKLQTDLEAKLRSAQNLNESLQSELQKVRNEHTTSEHDLRSQIDAMTSRAADENEWKGRYEALDKSYQDLRSEISSQEKVTSEVREEATAFLSEMKALSGRSNQSSEREEKLFTQVQRLENELKEWKSRYAQAKAQPRAAQLSSTATSLPLPDVGAIAKVGSYVARDGLVKDIHLAVFQMAVDELLRSTRSQEPRSVLPHVKSVVIAVRDISLDVGNTQSNSDEATTQQRHKAKAKVSATANNLITATKNFAISHGHSPVSLLDAAASHLATSIVELIQLVRIRPSPPEELEDDANSDIADSPADYYGILNGRPIIGEKSTHSTHSIPQLKQRASNQEKPMPNGFSNGAPLKQPQRSDNNPQVNIEALRDFLDTRTNTLLTTLQTLVSSIRTSAPPPDILDTLQSIVSITSQIIHQTSESVSAGSKPGNIANTLAELVDKLEVKGREGEEVNSESVWKEYVKGLPPIGFEIAREVKELGGWVEGELRGADFS